MVTLLSSALKEQGADAVVLPAVVEQDREWMKRGSTDSKKAAESDQ